MSDEIDLRKQRKVEAEISMEVAGLATEAKQDAQITQLATLISNTTGMNLEVTQLLVKGVLDTIKTDTAKLDVLLSTRNAEVTQLLIKGVLDAIKIKTDNLDVALSTRATEVTVAAILAKLLSSIAVTATDLDIRNLTPFQDGVEIYGSDDGGVTKRIIQTDSTGQVVLNPLNEYRIRDTAGASITLGQKPMATSVPVVLASDQSPIPITGSITSNVSTRTILEEIQMTGLYQGKTAYIFNLIGQRNGFTSTSALDGVKEYGNGVSDFAVTSNSTLDIISSSANDTSAGTGVRTVKVTYINNSNNLVESAAITLNGTTLVTSVLTGVNQVLWMETATAGSGGVAAGNIRLRINGGVVEVEQITAGGNKSRSAIFMVPTGYTGYVINWRASAVNNDQDVRLRGQVNTLNRSLSTVFHYMSQKYTPLNTNIPAQPELFLKVPALAKIKANTVSGGTASTVRCNVNILMAIIQD